MWWINEKGENNFKFFIIIGIKRWAPGYQGNAYLYNNCKIFFSSNLIFQAIGLMHLIFQRIHSRFCLFFFTTENNVTHLRIQQQRTLWKKDQVFLSYTMRNGNNGLGPDKVGSSKQLFTVEKIRKKKNVL